MHIILGGTGQVGSAVARTLLDRGERATVVTRDRTNAADLERRGAEIAETDIRDVDRLRGVFRTGRRAFLLSPPADPSGDTDAEEKANVDAIMAALEGSGLEKVVLQSTYGAASEEEYGGPAGDMTVLHLFEDRLRGQPIPVTIIRGAYFMSNWTGMLGAVRESGALPSFFPAELALPTVAPADLGRAAADRMMEDVGQTGLHHVEGPSRPTPEEVADAFSRALDHSVSVAVIPREEWLNTFAQFGFSSAAALSYARMTGAVADGATSGPNDPERGTTDFDSYVRKAVRAEG